MQWFASLPPVFVTIVAIAALVSIRKIVVAWIGRSRSPDEISPLTVRLLERMEGRLMQLEAQVTSLSDELAATRTEFRALARGAAPTALPGAPAPRQDGAADVMSADPAPRSLSS